MSQPTKAIIQEHYHLFGTRLGACGIAWSEGGVTRVQLPERAPTATERRLRARSANTGASVPPALVREAIAMLECYFAGERVDFASVALDLGGVGPFHRKIYDLARSLDWGQTASYGDLARQAGSPGAARAVGQAMGHNPVPIIIPCHRVLASGRRIGGFSAFGGALTKERLLALEGVHLGSGTPLLPGLLPAAQGTAKAR
jgi:methylated-DNA-[protein]-cysteine S-methyltransferase